jgi:hypothetical protein
VGANIAIQIESVANGDHRLIVYDDYTYRWSFWSTDRTTRWRVNDDRTFSYYNWGNDREDGHWEDLDDAGDPIEKEMIEAFKTVIIEKELLG